MGRMKETLFDPYPIGPGYQATDTSYESAVKVEPRVGTLRRLSLDAIIHAGGYGATADEVAMLVDATVLAIRPRITELKKLGLIVPSGEKRENESGHRADVMVYNGPAQMRLL